MQNKWGSQFLITLCIFGPPGIHAESPVVDKYKNEDLNIIQKQSIAKDAVENPYYKLSTEDVKKYHWLMEETTAGSWYKDLTPVEVLGLMAQNASERQKFADLFVKQQHARISNVIAFQHAYDRAWEQNYPNEAVIGTNNSAEQGADPVYEDSDDRFVAFIDIHDADSQELVRRLLERISYSYVRLDLYIVNKLSDKELQQWASNMHIPLEQVNSGKITLNHDKGRIKKYLNGSSTQVPLLLLNKKGKLNVVAAGTV